MLAGNNDELVATRATLLQRLKNWEDQSSWQDFFDTYWKLIYNVAIKGGLSPAEAEDIVQETIISVAKHMPTFQYDSSIGSFKTWLFNMTRWRMIDYIREKHQTPSTTSRKKPSRSEPTDEEETQTIHRIMDPASKELYVAWSQEWESNLLDTAVAKIKRRVDPEKYQIFNFYVNKDWPVEKVAKHFDMPVDQVYLIKHRITGMIKDELNRIKKEFE